MSSKAPNVININRPNNISGTPISPPIDASIENNPAINRLPRQGLQPTSELQRLSTYDDMVHDTNPTGIPSVDKVDLRNSEARFASVGIPDYNFIGEIVPERITVNEQMIRSMSPRRSPRPRLGINNVNIVESLFLDEIDKPLPIKIISDDEELTEDDELISSTITDIADSLVTSSKIIDNAQFLRRIIARNIPLDPIRNEFPGSISMTQLGQNKPNTSLRIEAQRLSNTDLNKYTLEELKEFASQIPGIKVRGHSRASYALALQMYAI